MTITRGGSALPRATPSRRPIPSSVDVALVEDVDRDARGFTDFSGAFGKDCGREHVRRLVAQARARCSTIHQEYGLG